MMDAATLSRGKIDGYPAVGRALHWLTAALVIALVVVGIVMIKMPEGAAQTVLFDLHRSVGILLLPLILVRLAYRVTHTFPRLPADIPALQQFAAHANHWLLYAALVAQPMIGWLGMSAFGEPIRVLWLFDVPTIWPKDEALSERLFQVHSWVGIAIAALVVVHIAAALFHHFVRRDTVLARMVSG
jgi:cytochrome b561